MKACQSDLDQARRCPHTMQNVWRSCPGGQNQMNRPGGDNQCHENQTRRQCRGIERHHSTTFSPGHRSSLRPGTRSRACISRSLDEISPEDFLKYVKAVSPSAYEPLSAVVADRGAWTRFRRMVAEAFCKERSWYFLERMPSYPLCFGEPKGMPRRTSVVFSKTHRMFLFEDLADLALSVLRQDKIIKRML